MPGHSAQATRYISVYRASVKNSSADFDYPSKIYLKLKKYKILNRLSDFVEVLVLVFFYPNVYYMFCYGACDRPFGQRFPLNQPSPLQCYWFIWQIGAINNAACIVSTGSLHPIKPSLKGAVPITYL